MKYEYPVTPADPTNDCIKAIQGALAIETEPVYITVHPAEGAVCDECFPNVSSQVERNGGQQVLGWTVWELPGAFYEAEFHAVWEQPDGSLVDVTPKRYEARRILFLIDGKARYEGRQVNSLRIPVSRDPAVLDFIKASNAEFEILNEGDRSTQHGQIALSGSDLNRYDAIQQMKVDSFLKLRRVVRDIGPYTPCVCGCGRKGKWCASAR
ncbi:hypothetical protein [Xylophilus ampelinus]|uniref:SEC-C motif-containing protein n=1 Tax=Xylophilus ampelinus TaxID=54067 RepID=A0A318SUT8_9BURK|nr:hypothetical protein [Xylophilus ampelinus]MCS4509954.1 hypothetical protein [Xylophilus ampelinus]PYE78467.1 hypothetical protein DFQ15_107117 [Xylophilus ampelinus]